MDIVNLFMLLITIGYILLDITYLKEKEDDTTMKKLSDKEEQLILEKQERDNWQPRKDRLF